MTEASDTGSGLWSARLRRYGLLSVTGEDARGFLHAQLTNDIEQMPTDQARLAGWCSAKGRLLASFLVMPHNRDFLLQLAADLAPAVAKRLSMFVLRSKVKITDLGPEHGQLGIWGGAAPARLAQQGIRLGAAPMACAVHGALTAVRIERDRVLVLGPEAELERLQSGLAAAEGSEDEWSLAEIRAGRPLIRQATQDLFVPQMVNLEALGAVDFKKGCYPGQEVVARAQYRGQVKRRMVRGAAEAGAQAGPGADLYSDDLPGQASGTVVDSAPSPEGRELLAVVPVSALERQARVRLAPEGPALQILSLPYSSS
jgi:hypothetical protein